MKIIEVGNADRASHAVRNASVTMRVANATRGDVIDVALQQLHETRDSVFGIIVRNLDTEEIVFPGDPLLTGRFIVRVARD